MALFNPLLLGIAKTHLLARKKQSAIAALGVTFGIGVFIIMVSFMTGLNGLLDGIILNRTPHVRIYNEVKQSERQPIEDLATYKDKAHIIHSIKPKNSQLKLRNGLAIRAELRKDKRVKGITPQVSTRIFYQAGAVQLNGNLAGMDVLEEARLFNFQQYIVGGKPEDLASNENAIVLGAGVAKNLSLQVGDYVQIVSINGSRERLKIVGLFQSGLADIDKVFSYCNIGTAQRLSGEGGDYFTDLHLKLHDIEAAAGMAEELRNSWGVNAIDIKTANAQFETATSIRNMITYAVSFALLIVAGFGIYNILNMLIYEKMPDIAILKATGFSSGDVQRIFLYQAMMIGFVGAAIGLAFGFLASYGISQAPFETEALPTIKTFPVNFDPKFYIIGIIFALITTFLAGFMPSRKAGKIDPVDILRGQ